MAKLYFFWLLVIAVFLNLSGFYWYEEWVRHYWLAGMGLTLMFGSLTILFLVLKTMVHVRVVGDSFYHDAYSIAFLGLGVFIAVVAYVLYGCEVTTTTHTVSEFQSLFVISVIFSSCYFYELYKDVS